MGSSVIYKNNSTGEYFIYSGEDSVKTLIPKDSDARFVEIIGGNFCVLYTGSAYELYNANGEKLITVNTAYDMSSNITAHPFKVVLNGGSYVLLSVERVVGHPKFESEVTYETVYFVIK